MKRSILAGAVLSLVVGAMASASVMAANTDPGGTITIDGQVRTETCTVNVNGDGTGDATIQMPDAFVTDFTVTQGTPLPTKQGDVSIKLSACLASATSVAAHFDRQSANIKTGTNFLKNTANGGLANLGYALLDGQNGDALIDLGNAAYNETAETITGNAATLDYKVAYVESGAGNVGPSEVDSSITYDLYYQ